VEDTVSLDTPSEQSFESALCASYGHKSRIGKGNTFVSGREEVTDVSHDMCEVSVTFGMIGL
jgi:hypothetical protein